jgi:hypothetical protein
VAGFQDWDGIYFFDYLSFTNDYDGNRIRGFFTAQGHPAQEAFTPLAALLFRRGLVKSGTRPLTLSVSEDRILADQADRGMWGSFDRFWSEGRITRPAALKHRMALQLLPGDVPTRASRTPEAASGPITGDTGEMTWDAGRPRFTLNAPGARLLLGKVGGATTTVGDVRFEVAPMGGNEHAHLGLVSLDGRPLSETARALLVALGRAENQEMGWNADRTSVGDRWGRGPALIQGVRATISLPGSWNVAALDPTGAPKGSVATAGSSVRIDPSYRTAWYLLTRAR